MAKVAVIQSNYIPWKGYFDIIHDVDLFIFYDDVQYTKNDWRNRNKIKAAHGLSWLTIPVGSHNGKLIYQIDLTDTRWCSKHWSTIRQYYSKAPYFEQYRGFFENVYLETEWTNLSDLNQFLIRTVSTEFLKVNTRIKDSREFCIEGSKLDRLIDLLQKVDATAYVSGPSARGYIDERKFAKVGIELIYKDYSGYPEYPQLFPPFEHQVSILDVLLNCGPKSHWYIWGWRQDTLNAGEPNILTGETYETE